MMFTFKSKPIQISGETVLCDDGSIWEQRGIDREWTQVAAYEAPQKKQTKKPKNDGYTEGFNVFWEEWTKWIKNGSNKASAFAKYKLLSPEEVHSLYMSVEPYSKTEPVEKHKYLMRCETYINKSHWENVGVFGEVANATIPPLSDERWKKEISCPNGIVEEARICVESFGMDINEAWRMVNE